MCGCYGDIICIACKFYEWISGEGKIRKVEVEKCWRDDSVLWDACFESFDFGIVVIVCSVALSAIYVVSYEFFEGFGDGCVVNYFIDEGVDIDCVECL